MKELARLLVVLLSWSVSHAQGAGGSLPTPHPVTATFYIENVHCYACVAIISDSVKKVRSVTDFQMDPAAGYALISFDTHAASYHQIAQAIADSDRLHGEPYVPSVKFTVPSYKEGDHAAKVDDVFARRKDWVKVECRNRDKGLFRVTFLPLKVDPKNSRPQGWNAGHFGHPIHDPPPKGLGLEFQMVREGGKQD